MHNPSLTPSSSLQCRLKDKVGKKKNMALGKRIAAWVRHYSRHLGMYSKEEMSSKRKGVPVRNKEDTETGDLHSWKCVFLFISGR